MSTKTLVIRLCRPEPPPKLIAGQATSQEIQRFALKSLKAANRWFSRDDSGERTCDRQGSRASAGAAVAVVGGLRLVRAERGGRRLRARRVLGPPPQLDAA